MLTYDPLSKGWTCHQPTADELLASTIRGHLDTPNPDAILSIETHLFNVSLTTDNVRMFTLDVGKQMQLNKARWSRLVKEYVPLDQLQRFVGQTCEILNGDARLGATTNFFFRDPPRADKKHRWGGCLIGAAFRGDNRKAGPATLTFYSRTTYLGYMGVLDLALAYCMAEEIAFAYGTGQHQGDMTPAAFPIRFHWHIASMQLHAFKSLPYFFSQPDIMSQLDALTKRRECWDPRLGAQKMQPTWRYLASWYWRVKNDWAKSGGNVGRFLSAEKYGPFKRVKRRWLEHTGVLTHHIPPSLPVQCLDFSKAV